MSSKSKTSTMRLTRGLSIIALAGTMACTPIIRNHGYMPLAEDLALVEIGTDTRESLMTTLGPPVSGGVLSDSGYYYVASKFRHYGAFAPEEIEREVLAVSFNEAGIVTNIERFGLQDGNVVILSRRVTDNGVRDTTLVRQLLRNIGNFNAASVFGES